jgi:hypothetical protein
MMNPRVLASCFALLLLGASTASASVTITDGEGHAYVRDYGSGYAEDDLGGSANSSATASLTGFLSTTQRTVDSYGIQHDFDHMRAGGRYDDAGGYSLTEFVPDADTTYSLFGDYGNSSGTTAVYAFLEDVTLGQFLFYQADENFAEAPNSVSLGAVSGNIFINMFGSTTGTLLAGRTYKLFTRTYLFVSPSMRLFGRLLSNILRDVRAAVGAAVV